MVTFSAFSTAGCMREIVDLLPTTAIPAPAPTPRPAPTPSVIATPVPTPAPTPAASSDCPSLLGLRLTVLHDDPAKNRLILDMTPLTEDCKASFPGRLNCPLGPAGTQRRADCEAVRIGAAGPEWSFAGRGHASLRPLPDTFYTAEVIGKGVVTVCSRVQPELCTYWDVQ
jgi:hypothetical protein